MPVLRWTIPRIIQLVLTLLVASLVVYGSVFLVPGDPATLLGGGKALSPEALAVIRERYGLDDGFLTQYWHWLTGLFSGDLGQSAQYRQPVSAIIESRVATTVELVLLAGLLVVVLGIGAGAIAALRGKRVDDAITFGVTILAAVPSFVAAIVLIFLFSVQLEWLPSGGDGEGFVGTLSHLLLPAIALAVSFMAVVARISRSAMRREMVREHVELARSRGLPNGLVVRRHILWNALPPISTVVAMVLAGLIGGTTIVESAFGLHGLGSLLVNSVQSKDFPIVQAVVLMMVAAFVVANTLADLLALIINPKARKGAGL
ncbi:ABC transporter permease [Sphaerisporangium sp. NPDC051017]|uniref:ABC transporter permease n=1 Tax=Sphaerisporangium sp. NPDC051017 TaxID=3154636 RepID=UPI003412AF7B